MAGYRTLRRTAATLCLAAAPALGACAGSVSHLPETPGPVEVRMAGEEGAPEGARPDPGGAIELQYLGVGGWAIRWRGASILTAPFFSNPSFLRVGLWSIHADSTRIERFLPDVSDARAILVGHAHYDHLMDVPYVARAGAPRATIFGSRTMVHTLAGFTDLDRAGRLVALNDSMGDHRRPGAWIEVAGGRIRFMALRSSHAPHFLGQTFYQGSRDRDFPGEPGLATEWLEGQTMAFLVDLLDEEGAVAFRIYYQDSASQAPAGLVPDLASEDARRVDVAILCPPSFDNVERYPEAILGNIRPRHVLLGHWEDFFRSRARPLRVVPFTDLQEFIDRMIPALPRDASWTLPEPGTTVRFRLAGGNSRE